MRPLLLLAVLLAGGCAAPAPLPGPSPRPAGDGPAAAPPAPLASEAALLSLEDRRAWEGETLRAYLGHRDAPVRRRAALAAARIRDRRSAPLLVPLLTDPDTGVAAMAAFGLGQLGDTTAVSALATLLDRGRLGTAPTVVAEAATALGKLRTAQGRAALEGFLRQAPREGPGVRTAVGAALLAVWRFPRPADAAPILPWLDADSALAWRAAYALSRRPDPAGTRALAARMDHPAPLVRSFAARALTAPLADSSGIGRARALELLRRATADREQAVRVNAVRSLGTYEEAVPTLRGLLAAGDAYLAITAAESLGRLGTGAAPAAPELAAAAREARLPLAVRGAAVVALASVSREAAAPAVAALRQAPEWRLRAAAARAAAEMRDWTAAADFLRDGDPRVAAVAMDAVVTAAGDSVAPVRLLLVEALGHPDPAARASALNGLARFADPSDVPLLLDAYQRAQADSLLNDAALAAIAALGAVAERHGPAPARAFFTRFRRSRDYLVRRAAAAAFGDSLAAAAWGPVLPIEGALAAERAEQVLRESLPRRARIATAGGWIELELYADAPLTVRNFAGLARRGFFDGQEWPRVVPNFVIQGGDPRGDTSGGPGYAIRDEINRHPYVTGTLGMALSGPDTGGSQWFITHTPQPHLDGTYTVFGRVLHGMDVVDRVLPGDRIERIEVMP